MAAPKYLENYVYRLIPDTVRGGCEAAAAAACADTGRFLLNDILRSAQLTQFLAEHSVETFICCSSLQYIFMKIHQYVPNNVTIFKVEYVIF